MPAWRTGWWPVLGSCQGPGLNSLCCVGHSWGAGVSRSSNNSISRASSSNVSSHSSRSNSSNNSSSSLLSSRRQRPHGRISSSNSNNNSNSLHNTLCCSSCSILCCSIYSSSNNNTNNLHPGPTISPWRVPSQGANPRWGDIFAGPMTCAAMATTATNGRRAGAETWCRPFGRPGRGGGLRRRRREWEGEDAGGGEAGDPGEVGAGGGTAGKLALWRRRRGKVRR